MGSSGREVKHKMTEIVAGTVERGAGRTIVAAVDESVQADDVFDFVCQHFNSADTAVVFVHVAKPFDLPFQSFSATASEARNKEYLADGWIKRAQELKMSFQAQGRVLVGDPREELLVFCEHVRPDALVMGSHGRGALSRAMLGSVSDHCVHFCSCPVMVVKPKKDAKPDESGYSSVFRLAAKSLGLHHILKDKPKANAAEALQEADKKDKEDKKGSGDAKMEDIKLEEVVPMGSPFPPEQDPPKFPESETPFPQPSIGA